MIASTRHGYASGGAVTKGAGAAPSSEGAIAYPRYEPSSDVDDVQLRPNRRALFIGVAILIVGVIALLAVVLGGGKEPETQLPTPTESDNAAGSSAAATPAVVKPDTKPEFAIHIVSDPRNAVVLLDGIRVGVTPFSDKVNRGTKIAQLTVHADGYVDFTSKIDLAGDEYTNDKVKLAKIPDPAVPMSTDGADKGSNDTHPRTATPTTTITTPHTNTTSPTATTRPTATTTNHPATPTTNHPSTNHSGTTSPTPRAHAGRPAEEQLSDPQPDRSVRHAPDLQVTTR